MWSFLCLLSVCRILWCVGTLATEGNAELRQHRFFEGGRMRAPAALGQLMIVRFVQKASESYRVSRVATPWGVDHTLFKGAYGAKQFAPIQMDDYSHPILLIACAMR